MCYEKHGHFKNHILLKYYNRLGSLNIKYRRENPRDNDLVVPHCSSCHVGLKYPTNRSITDEQIYLCDSCLNKPEYAKHLMRRVKIDEVKLNTHLYDDSFVCEECYNDIKVPPGASRGYRCLTCRTPVRKGDICVTCHSSSTVMAKHQGHNIVPRPAPNNHACMCDICRRTMHFGVRYRCSVSNFNSARYTPSQHVH